MKSFASDNYSGIHPEVLRAIAEANTGHEPSYSADSVSAETNLLFENLFGTVKVLYTFNGTGANVVSLKCATLPFQAVICAETAHINADECGAPTQSIGASLITISTPDGKLTPSLIQPYLLRIGNVHNTQPKVISISQSTEMGTVYSCTEMRALCDFAHANDMYIHVDGARIANALAALKVSPADATVNCGVDIMSFGGTKNGILIGEAVLIFNTELMKYADFYQKQSAQLFSKNRFIAAQFKALLNNDLWLTLASHANDMAQLLAKEAVKVPGVKLTQIPQANAVFVTIPKHAIKPMQDKYHFYIWNEQSFELRWMCSYDTMPDEVYAFVASLNELCVQKA